MSYTQNGAFGSPSKPPVVRAPSRPTSPSKTNIGRPMATPRSPSPTKIQQPKAMHQQQQPPQLLQMATPNAGSPEQLRSSTPRPMDTTPVTLSPVPLTQSGHPVQFGDFVLPPNYVQDPIFASQPAAAASSSPVSDTLNPQPGPNSPCKPKVASQSAATAPKRTSNIDEATIRSYLSTGDARQDSVYESHVITLDSHDHISSYTVLHAPPPNSSYAGRFHGNSQADLQDLMCNTNVDMLALETVMNVSRLVAEGKGEGWFISGLKVFPVGDMKMFGRAAATGSFFRATPTSYLKIHLSMVSTKGLKQEKVGTKHGEK